MRRSLLAICIGGVAGTALLAAGLQTIPSTAAVSESAGRSHTRTVAYKTSFLAPKHLYLGFVNYGGRWKEVMGHVPASTPRAALALALAIEAEIAAAVDKAGRAMKTRPRTYPGGAYMNDLVYRSVDRYQLKRRYDISITH